MITNQLKLKEEKKKKTEMKITDEKAQQELPMMLPEMERSCPHTSVNNWVPLALVNHLKPISSMTWAITKSDALDVVGFTKFFFFFPLFFVLFILFYFSVSFEYFFFKFYLFIYGSAFLL